MCLVSVILPVYNVDEYLNHSLDCLVNQTLKDIEIICVDDSSNDSSAEIIKSYSLKDNRVKYIYQEHSFAGGARNRGLEEAQGKYVIFLDPDDYYDITMLEKLYNKIEQDGTDITICGVYSVKNSGISYTPPSYKHYINTFLDNKIFSVKDIGDDIWYFLVYPYNKIYKKEFLIKNNIKFQPIKNTNDASFALESLIAASKISLINQAFYYYRYARPNNTRLTKGKSLDCVIKAYEYAYKVCSKYENFESVKHGFFTIIFSSLIWHINTYCRNHDKDKQIFYEYVREKLLTYYKTENDLQESLKTFNFYQYNTAKLILKFNYKDFCKYINGNTFINIEINPNKFKVKIGKITLYKHSYTSKSERFSILNIPVKKIKIKNSKKNTYFFNIKIKSEKFIPSDVRVYLNYVTNLLENSECKKTYILNEHIGESFLLSNLLDKILKNDNANKVNFILQKNYQKEILNTFVPDNKKASVIVVPVPVNLRKDTALYLADENEYKDFSFRVLMPEKFWCSKEVKNNHYFDLICRELNIDGKDFHVNSKILETAPPPIINKKIEENDLNLENFIFISPESISVRAVSITHWETLVRELKQAGYDIYLNITDKNNFISGTKCFYTNISEAFYLAGKAKYIIGMRSGILEMLAYTGTETFAVYNGDNRIKRNSLLKLPSLNNDKIHEFDYSINNKCFTQIIENIING